MVFVLEGASLLVLEGYICPILGYVHWRDAALIH